MKHCSLCGVEKSLSMFYVDNFPRNKTGRQSRCIACAKSGALQRRIADPLAADAAVKRWKLANPERAREHVRTKIARKPDLYKAINRAKTKRYRERHPDRVAADQKANGAARMRCLYAVARAYRDAGIPCEVDHVIPLKHRLVCGLHAFTNLNLVPTATNRAKRNVWHMEA